MYYTVVILMMSHTNLNFEIKFKLVEVRRMRIGPFFKDSINSISLILSSCANLHSPDIFVFSNTNALRKLDYEISH